MANFRVLVTETSHDGNFYVAHNEFYEQAKLISCTIYKLQRLALFIHWWLRSWNNRALAASLCWGLRDFLRIRILILQGRVHIHSQERSISRTRINIKLAREGEYICLLWLAKYQYRVLLLVAKLLYKY